MSSKPKQDPKDRRFAENLVLTGLVITSVIVPLGYYLMPEPTMRLETAWQRIVFTLRWQTLSMLTFMFGLQRVMNLRRTSAAINPITGNAERYIEVDNRYLQNTFEQFTVSVFGQLVLASYLDDRVQKLIPVLVVYFVVARAIFYVGYVLDPLKRALGMSMTYAPNVVIYPYILFCLITEGPTHELSN